MTERLGMKVMKFVVANAVLVKVGQGNISIACPELWEMEDSEFKNKFEVI